MTTTSGVIRGDRRAFADTRVAVAEPRLRPRRCLQPTHVSFSRGTPDRRAGPLTQPPAGRSGPEGCHYLVVRFHRARLWEDRRHVLFRLSRPSGCARPARPQPTRPARAGAIFCTNRPRASLPAISSPWRASSYAASTCSSSSSTARAASSSQAARPTRAAAGLHNRLATSASSWPSSRSVS